ncbi:MAG: hypothetical protein IT292_01010 [Deltaproteobacteria bacterium]|nr:hypothetical protein [Deltaproteobacteria bacterium]
MVRIVYIVWFLLPLSLIMLSVSAVARNTVGKLKKGYAGFYFKQAIVSLLVFVLAVYIDKNWFAELFEPIAIYFTDRTDIAVSIMSWLVYPVLLFAFSLVAGSFIRKDNSPKVKTNKR